MYLLQLPLCKSVEIEKIPKIYGYVLESDEEFMIDDGSIGLSADMRMKFSSDVFNLKFRTSDFSDRGPFQYWSFMSGQSRVIRLTMQHYKLQRALVRIREIMELTGGYYNSVCLSLITKINAKMTGLIHECRAFLLECIV